MSKASVVLALFTLTHACGDDQARLARGGGSGPTSEKVCTTLGVERHNFIKLTKHVFPEAIKIEMDGQAVATRCKYEDDIHSTDKTIFDFPAPNKSAVEGAEPLERKIKLKVTAFPAECSVDKGIKDVSILEGEITFIEGSEIPNGEGCGAEWSGMTLEREELTNEFYRIASLPEIGQRTYYTFEGSSFCSRGESIEPIPTWQGEVIFKAEGVKALGSICDPDTSSFEDYDSGKFKFNIDLSRMKYADNIYEYHSLPPEICDDSGGCAVPSRDDSE